MPWTGDGHARKQGCGHQRLCAQRADNQVFVDILAYAVPFETNLYGAEFNNELRTQLEALWLNETTVDEVAASIDAEAELILAGDK